jgi:hypothetical protein
MSKLAAAIETLADAVERLEAAMDERRAARAGRIQAGEAAEPALAEAALRLGGVIGKLHAALER